MGRNCSEILNHHFQFSGGLNNSEIIYEMFQDKPTFFQKNTQKFIKIPKKLSKFFKNLRFSQIFFFLNFLPKMKSSESAKLLWHFGEHEKSLKHLLSLISNSEDNEENSKNEEIEEFFNFILSQTSDPAILDIFISFLDEIIVASPELAFRIIKENHVNDKIVMKKITKSRSLKIRYLEFLVEQKTAKKFVFEELLKEYYKDKNFRAFLQLAENSETWKFVKARKLIDLEFGSSVDGLLAKCAVFGEAGQLKMAFQESEKKQETNLMSKDITLKFRDSLETEKNN